MGDRGGIDEAAGAEFIDRAVALGVAELGALGVSTATAPLDISPWCVSSAAAIRGAEGVSADGAIALLKAEAPA